MTDNGSIFLSEVSRLHTVIEGWTTGRLPETDEAFAGFADALDPQFVLINPEGSIERRDHVVTRFRQRHGARGAHAFRITIAEARLRFVLADHALVNYEEHWHRGDDPAGTILASAWLRHTKRAPGGVGWLHLHETWLTPPPMKRPGPT